MESLKKIDNFVYAGYKYDFCEDRLIKKPHTMTWKDYLNEKSQTDIYFQELKYVEVEINFDIDEDTLLIFHKYIVFDLDIGRAVYYIKENGKAYLLYYHNGREWWE
jgi:hypothetical protein